MDSQINGHHHGHGCGNGNGQTSSSPITPEKLMAQSGSLEWHVLSAVAAGVSPYFLPLLLLLLLLVRVAHRFIKQDYRAFLALGPGGTPYTFRGYCQLSFFRLFRLRHPRTPPEMPPSLWLRRGFLESLPRRKGHRPEVTGIAPQRQLTQQGPHSMFEELSKVIGDFARGYPAYCYLGRSTFEKHNTALFSRCVTYTEPRYCGEICHAHAKDGSMHLTLHPADIKTVLEAGWGERHPLARGDWWWQILAPVPPGFTMVYCPRDETELKHIKEIIRAAAWWVSGIDSNKVEESYT